MLTRIKEVMNNPDNLSIAPINVIEKVSVGINVYIFFFFLLSFRLPRNIDWWRMHSRMGCRTNCEMLQGSECPWTLNTNTNYNHLQHRWWRWTRSEWLVLVNGRIMTDGEWFMKRKEFFLSYFDSRFSGLEEISEVQPSSDSIYSLLYYVMSEHWCIVPLPHT